MARASRIVTTIGAIALATLLASCAPAVEVDEETVGASATPSASPEPTTFTTQNGTASFELPAGWTVEDTSALQPQSNHGGPIWQNSVALLDEDGERRATYGDGYGDDVGAADDTGVVQSIAMAHGLHAAAWWSSTLEGTSWTATATVVHDLDSPWTSVMPEGFDRLHSFSAELSDVPECSSVVDEASAVACLEAPGVTEALELLATLELDPLPWDAMPEGVDPQADVPWVDFATPDGTIAFSYPASWSVVDQSSPDLGAFVTLVTPDGFHALDVATQRDHPIHPFTSACAPGGTPLGPWTVLERRPIEPLDGALAGGAASGLETVTFEADDLVVVSMLLTADVDAGCLEQSILVPGGIVRATTPFQTDAPGLVYDLFPDRRLPLDSYEHGVIVEVLGTLRVTGLGAA